MKKMYITPSALIVVLGTCQMMAESLPIDNGGGSTIENPDDILTKENKDVNVWDEEW
ncbi:MAG: hypothetical protein J6W03_01550 [Bacteroidaceae bacterium]|nr:hypothetical protein [Bacteroidaceae bacterium]